jgi:hypothetical protein
LHDGAAARDGLDLALLAERASMALFLVTLSASLPVRLRSVVVTISVRVLLGFTSAI